MAVEINSFLVSRDVVRSGRLSAGHTPLTPVHTHTHTLGACCGVALSSWDDERRKSSWKKRHYWGQEKRSGTRNGGTGIALLFCFFFLKHLSRHQHVIHGIAESRPPPLQTGKPPAAAWAGEGTDRRGEPKQAALSPDAWRLLGWQLHWQAEWWGAGGSEPSTASFKGLRSKRQVADGGRAKGATSGTLFRILILPTSSLSMLQEDFLNVLEAIYDDFRNFYQSCH